MRDLARRLLAVEAASQIATGAHAHEAVRVCEKLQISLTRFAGSDGFKSLLRRALALAREDVLALQAVKLTPDRKDFDTPRTANVDRLWGEAVGIKETLAAPVRLERTRWAMLSATASSC